MVCDSLDTIIVKNSPNLKRLPLSIGNGQPPPAALKHIGGSQEWWQSLQWDHPDDITFFHQFLHFIEDVDIVHIPDISGEAILHEVERVMKRMEKRRQRYLFS